MWSNGKIEDKIKWEWYIFKVRKQLFCEIVGFFIPIDWFDRFLDRFKTLYISLLCEIIVTETTPLPTPIPTPLPANLSTPLPTLLPASNPADSHTGECPCFIPLPYLTTLTILTCFLILTFSYFTVDFTVGINVSINANVNRDKYAQVC